MKELEEHQDASSSKMDLFYQVKSAANFMDITPLLEMICLWLTGRIVELKDAEKVR